MKIRKWLSVLLVLCMALSLLPTAALAVDEPADTADVSYIETGSAAEEAAEEPVEERAEEPAEEPVEEPAEEAAEEPVEEPAEEAAEEPVEEPAEEPAEEPGGEIPAEPDALSGEPLPDEEPMAADGEGEMTWADLQTVFGAGGTITLTQDVTAASTDSALVVPSGKTVTLDLNGYTVDRGLKSPTSDGYVIKNEGTLTIRDGSSAQNGKITGGYNDEYEAEGVIPFGANQGGGIFNEGTLRLEGGSITGNRAKDNAGVFNNGSFTMTGGAITNNTSYLMGGAGVTNYYYGTFTMTGGTISGNSAVTRGGGVWSVNTFIMTGGTISGNTAGNNGGGICVRYGTTTISGGTITGNRATGTAPVEENVTVTGCGGGLYIDQGGQVTLSGGTITGNTAGKDGSDVYLNLDSSWNPTLKMNGSPVANVYLAEGKVITVTGAFTEGANVAVSTAAGTGVFTSGYGTYNGEAHPSQYFRASVSANGILLSDGEAALGAGVVNNVSYVERSWNGTEVVSETKTRDAIKVPSNGNMTSGWYYLDTDVKKNGRVESITGDVDLILGDGCTLDVKGLYVPAGSTLTIYGQTAGTGRIYSHPSGGAGIGGYSGHDNGSIVIHGGVIQADGYDHCAGIGSNDGRTGGPITIYGGTITARGGSDGAGIGGGRDCSGGNITIYGGTITANSSSDCCENGAGIGGGDCGAGGNITIYGGNITTYSRDGAGIGGGDDGDGGTVTIHGGTITSTKVNQGWGARIGGGADAAPGTIVINGGTITTVGGKGAGIGGGYRNKSGGKVTINGGVIDTTGDHGIGNGGDAKANVAVSLGYTDDMKDTISITASSIDGTVTMNKRFGSYVGNTLVIVFDVGPVSTQLANVCLKAYDEGAIDPVEYTEYSWNENTNSLETTEKTADSYTVVTSAVIAQNPDGLRSGTYVVKEDTTIEEYLYIRKGCTVNLVVLDGVTLTCKKGIGCGYDDDKEYAALNIFGTGKIIATGQKYAAGIGGKDEEANGNITIHGAAIDTTGGYHGAGIGGGDSGRDPDGTTSIRIYAGNITATGGEEAAGIGGGNEQPGAHTYIYGGTVTATSKSLGAGIGGGDEEGTLGVFIYGGTVTATGGEHGAGIGAGEGGGDLRKFENGGGVNILGGTVTATGGSEGAGIGAGFYENMSGTVRITGSPQKVTITGGSGAAGIGGGEGENNSKFDYNGDMKGTVTIDCANDSGLIKITGGTLAAGIGGGFTGNMDGKCYIKGGNVEVHAGYGGAGIGGGMEVDNGAGAEGGDVYIGGGTLKVFCTTSYSDAQAIGYGMQVALLGSDPSGSVYIASSNNKTGKYMRVCYSTDNGKTWSTAKAGDRSSKCHQDDIILLVTECDHCDHNGSSGLSYSDITAATHTKKCKYCGLEETEAHTFVNEVCTGCGCQESGQSVIRAWDELAAAMIAGGSYKLGGDVAADETSSPLVVPAGVSVELDLNGYTVECRDLSTNYTVAAAIGGALTLKDSRGGGQISSYRELEDLVYVQTGSFTLDGGTLFSFSGDDVVCIGEQGEFTMNGGSVTNFACDKMVTVEEDCSFTMNGGDITGTSNKYGSVYARYGSSFTMNDGTVTGNGQNYVVFAGGDVEILGGETTSTYGRAVYIAQNQNGDKYGTMTLTGGTVTGAGTGAGVILTAEKAVLKLSGSPEIVNGGAADVYLNDGAVIQVIGALDEDVEISLDVRESRVFAQGVGYTLKEEDVDRFSSDGFDVSLTDNNELALTAHPSDWPLLQELLTNGSGRTVTLEQDYTANASDQALVIPDGVSVTLDLNGHTIDGSVLKQCVMTIRGGLTVMDSGIGGEIKGVGGYYIVYVNGGSMVLQGGTVSGGDTVYGVIYDNNGSVTMNGGTIAANGSERAVYVIDSFTMNGGTITGNGAYGHLVCVAEDKTFTMNGGSIVCPAGSDYTYGVSLMWGSLTISGGAGIAQGVYVRSYNYDPFDTNKIDGMIYVSGELTGDPIPVKADFQSFGGSSPQQFVFVKGSSGYALQEEELLSHFTSADPAYGIRMSGGRGEMYVRQTYAVSFAPGDGTGEMDAAAAYEGVPFVLPSCGFTAPAGKVFTGWLADGETKRPGEEFVVTADTTVTAVWAEMTCPDCGADLSGISYCPNCYRCENCTTICRDCRERCILCDPGFNEETGRCSVCDSEPLDPIGPDDPGVIIIDPDPIIEPDPIPFDPDDNEPTGEPSDEPPVDSDQYTVVKVSPSAEWTKGSKTDVEITVRAAEGEDHSFAHFASVEIDGKALTQDTDYTVREGSTIVTLRAAALEKLSAGERTVTVTFDNGSASTKLTIREAAGGSGSSNSNSNRSSTGNDPKTGDPAAPVLWLTLLALCVTAICGVTFGIVKPRKKTGTVQK